MTQVLRRALHRTLLGAMSLALLAACSKADRAGESAETRRVTVGAPAPSYATLSLNDDSVSIAGLKGKVVVLNIWATWCRPCREEIPQLQKLHEEFGPKGLEVVGVSVDNSGSEEDIRAFMQEFGMTFAVWKDPDERVSTRYLTVGVPMTFVIDRQGVLRYKHIGPVSAGDTAFRRLVESSL